MERLKILIAALILCIVIIVHEFGHFLLAKTNGIVVEEFSVGMGPRILTTVKGGTRYSLKLIPFGGACQMKGEDDGDCSEGSFGSKNVWRRISVVAAGPIFNFVLAFLGAMIIVSFMGYDPATVVRVNEGSPEEQAGLQVGDLITEFDGKKIHMGRELYMYLTLEGLEDKEISIVVERDGKEEVLTYRPATQDRYMLGFSYTPSEEQAQIASLTLGGVLQKAGLEIGDIIYSIDGQKVESGAALEQYFTENPMDGRTLKLTYLRDGLEYEIEVTPEAVHYVAQGFSYNLASQKTNALGVIKYSFYETKYWIESTLLSLKLLVTGQIGMESVSGPVGVVEVIGDVYEDSKDTGSSLVTWLSMLEMLILISANLGIMNLIPFPALDGGRLIFLVIEAIRGKRVNPDAEGMVHFAGLMILMAFMLWVTFRDVIKLF